MRRVVELKPGDLLNGEFSHNVVLARRIQFIDDALLISICEQKQSSKIDEIFGIPATDGLDSIYDAIYDLTFIIEGQFVQFSCYGWYSVLIR